MKTLMVGLFILLTVLGCDNRPPINSHRFESQMMIYTSTFHEFGSRAEVFKDYIAITVWYRPNQSKERAQRLLDYLARIAEGKMEKTFRERSIDKRLVLLDQDDLY